jgi:DNA primase
LPRIPEKFIDDLVARTEIEDVCADYVQFARRTGARAVALCPFHSEKTPSFTINSDMNTFYCFGCHKGGGAVSFIMEIENVPFTDAIEILAKKQGLTVPYEQTAGRSREPEATSRKRIIEANTAAARFFYSQLGIGDSAKQYLAKRNIDPKTAKVFGIGFAPDSWDALCKCLRGEGFSNAEIFDAGLSKKGNKDGFYDAFRNRVIFPVIDTAGNVLGFSGRIIEGGAREQGKDGYTPAKYINSPDTAAYIKGKMIFALNLARKSPEDFFILTEGNIDAVMLHRYGFRNGVASLGTAFTADQARLLKKYKSKVVLSYDSDEAGRKASEKAAKILEAAGVEVRVLTIPNAKDPDEYIQKFGRDAFSNLLLGSQSPIEAALAKVYVKADTGADKGRIDAVNGAVAILAAIENPAEREVYTRTAGEKLGVTFSALSEAVALELRVQARKAKKTERGQSSQVIIDTPGKRGEGARRARFLRKDDAALPAQRGIISALYKYPETLRVLEETGFSDGELEVPILKVVFQELMQDALTGKNSDSAVILARLSRDFQQNEVSLAASCLLQDPAPASPERYMADCIEKLRTDAITNASGDINEKIAAMIEKKRQGGKSE